MLEEGEETKIALFGVVLADNLTNLGPFGSTIKIVIREANPFQKSTLLCVGVVFLVKLFLLDLNL